MASGYTFRGGVLIDPSGRSLGTGGKAGKNFLIKKYGLVHTGDGFYTSTLGLKPTDPVPVAVPLPPPPLNFRAASAERQRAAEQADRDAIEAENRLFFENLAKEEAAFQAEQDRLFAEARASADAINQSLIDELAAADAAAAQTEAQADAEVLRVRQALDEEVNFARAEVERFAQVERDTLAQLQQQTEAEAERLRLQSEAEAAAVGQQRAALEAQVERARGEERAAAERLRVDRETVQREGAEREIASRRAGRSARARPLMSAVDGMAKPGTGLGAAPRITSPAPALGVWGEHEVDYVLLARLPGPGADLPLTPNPVSPQSLSTKKLQGTFFVLLYTD